MYISNPAAIKSEKGKLKQFIIEYNVDEETGEILTPKKVQRINLEKTMEYCELTTHACKAQPVMKISSGAYKSLVFCYIWKYQGTKVDYILTV
jgi:flavoprotein